MSDNIPKKFVGLHAHSVFSIGDAIGYPQEHIDFAIKNGMDALALSDHGNQDGISHQLLHAEKLKKQGINFRAIPSVEAYFVDSLKNWKILNEETKLQKQQEKLEKKKRSKKEDNTLNNIGNEFTEEEKYVKELSKSEKEEVDEQNTVIENESESKSNKWSNPLKQRNHLVILPKNNEGLKAIFQLVSYSFTNGFYFFPRVDFEAIAKHSKGNLIGTSACLAGRIGKAVFDCYGDLENIDFSKNNPSFEKAQNEVWSIIQRFYEVFGGEDNFYPEIQFNKLPAQTLLNMHILEAAKRHSEIKIVATCDSHYSNPEHWREREIYKAMAWASRSKKLVDPETLPKKIEELKCQLYPKNAEQIWESYKEYSIGYDFYDDSQVREAIERTHDIAWQQIEEISIDKKVKLPKIDKLIEDESKIKENVNEDDIAFEELSRLSYDGLKLRSKDKDERYVKRLEKELDIVKELKFSKYFLTVYKFESLIAEKMLVGCGRGSGVGFLLCYALFLTHVDPIKYNLLSERFLVRGKKGHPDLDLDHSDKILAGEIIKEYFGEENVVKISTFGQLRIRSLIKDLARLYSIPFEEINPITIKVEQETLAEERKVDGFDKAVWELTYAGAVKHSPTFRELLETYPNLDSSLQVLYKQIKSRGTHAGGLLISDNILSNMPVVKIGDNLQTPWTEGVNYRHLEEFGFLKFDILGLATLKMFENCIRRILKKEGNLYPTFKDVKKWYWEKLHPDNNLMDDINVYKNVYWNGNFFGVFQFQEEPVQKFCMGVKPTSIEDISAITSCYRPGPMQANAHNVYLDYKNNPEKVKYRHTLQEKVLSKTSGVLLYQEQLMEMYNVLGGIPLEETDPIRKVFTKKEISSKDKKEAELERLNLEFQELCIKNNNIDKEISKEVFNDMKDFVGYLFNKSHSVSYSINSYQCAYLLTYYQDEWVSTYIDFCSTEKGKITGQEDPKAIAIRDAKSLGYILGKPDINYSTEETVIKEIDGKKTIIPSFLSLKGIGKTAIEEIKMYRQYRNVEDLLWNQDETWRHSKFNKRSLSALIKLEALDSMGIVGKDKHFKNYKHLHSVIIDNVEEIRRPLERKNKRNFREVMHSLIEKYKDEPDWTKREKIEQQKELAGSVDSELIINQHIIEVLKSRNILSVDDWREEDQYNWFWGIVLKCDVAITKTNRHYLKARIVGEAYTKGEVSQEQSFNVWNVNPNTINELVEENCVIIFRAKRNNFGLSTEVNNVRKIG